jgi:hypothetical protein
MKAQQIFVAFVLLAIGVSACSGSSSQPDLNGT